MIDYDSFSRCHLTDIFFAFHAGAKELKGLKYCDGIASNSEAGPNTCFSAIVSSQLPSDNLFFSQSFVERIIRGILRSLYWSVQGENEMGWEKLSGKIIFSSSNQLYFTYLVTDLVAFGEHLPKVFPCNGIGSRQLNIAFDAN